MSLLSRALPSRALALLALAAGLLAAPLLRAQYGPDNPDPSGNYITNFEFTQSAPGLSSNTYDAVRKLPGRDTYLMIPDRTGVITLSLNLTFTHSALSVIVVDSMGAVVTSTSSISSGAVTSLSIPVIKFYPPFHVIVKTPAGNSAVAVKTIVIPRDANAPDTPLFVGSPSGTGVGGPLMTSPPSSPHYPTTSQSNQSSVAGENYGSCGSCAGTCTTMPPPVTTTQDEADISGPASVSGPLGQGFLHNTQSVGTSAGGMSTSYLGFDISPTGGISRADFKVNGSGDVTVVRDLTTHEITEITTASLYTQVETVSGGVMVSQWRTQALSATTPLRTSFYRTTGTNEITKTTTIDSHAIDTIWRYNPATPKWELEMGKVPGLGTSGLRKKEITLESNGGDASLRLERQKLYEWDSTVTPAAYVLVSDVIVTYKRLSFGWKKIKQEVLGLSGNPLTTVWEYWGASDVTGTASSTNGQGLLKHVARPDGWTCDYTYNFASGAAVYSRNATSPYLGIAGGCVEYVNVGTTWCSRVLTLSGQSIEQTMSTWSGDTLTEQVSNGPNTLTTTTTVVPIWTDFGGLPASIVYPDGTALIATYSRAGGGTTITWRQGQLSAGSIVDGTVTQRVADESGFPAALLKTDIVSSVTLEYPAVTSTDGWGRPTSIKYFNNPSLIESYTYNCCGLATSTDRNGLLTSYAHDDVHRLVKSNRAEVSYQTVYAGLEIRRYRYPETTMTAPSNPTDAAYQVSISSRDLSGTVVKSWQCSPETLSMIALSTTTAVYLNPAAASPNPGGLAAGIGMKTTRVLYGTPDDTATPQEVTLSYLDGRTYQINGNLGTRLRYSYGIASYDMDWDGTPDTLVRTVTTKRLALDGVTEKESAIRTVDPSGKTLAVSGFGAGATHYLYNALGQLVKSKDADGVIHLYGYNNLGDRVLSVLDLDADGVVDYGSDQVSFSESRPDASGAFGAIRTVTKVWKPGAAVGLPTTLSYEDASPDGLLSKVERFPAIGGIQSSGLKSFGSGGAWTETVTREDNTLSRRYYQAGRLVAETFWAAGSTPPGSAPPNIMSVATVGFIQGTAYGYDLLGRLFTATDSRTGSVTTEYVSVACDYVANVKDAASRVTAYLYDDRGRRTTVNQPDTPNPAGGSFTNVVTTHHYEDDTVKEVDGATYRTTYIYDYAQRMASLTTYGTVTATTTWNYDSSTGRLTSKRDAAGKGPDYTYTSAGRLLTRTWARDVPSSPGTRITTTYGYTSGRLTTISYNDGTPGVNHSYDSLGRSLSLANGVAKSDFTYDSATLRPDTETISYNLDGVPGYEFSRVLDRSRDSTDRDTGWQLKDGLTVENQVVYGYHASSGRLTSVGNGTATFNYGYTTGSYGLLDTVTGPVHTVRNTWDSSRDVLLTKDNKAGSTVISNYGYTVNDLGQRRYLTQAGTAFGASSAVNWDYNSRGEVTSADHSTVFQMDRFYAYDGIGNRLKWRWQTPSDSGGILTTYTPDALNQYTAISGQNNASPLYDLDGNQINSFLPVNGSAATWVWDAENRLIEAKSNGATVGTYQYDALGRRVFKHGYFGKVWFIYDGWNLIAEYDFNSGSTPVLNRTHTWGQDLSGSFQGAGGVGGLLSSKIAGTTCYPLYDGNGNICQYIDGAGAIVYGVEYDPSGVVSNVIYGPTVPVTLRFSTKYEDFETGLNYYGYRYLDTQSGRWLNRDPIEENGGVNLYGFVENSSIGQIDLLGLNGLTMEAAVVEGLVAEVQLGTLSAGEAIAEAAAKKLSADAMKALVAALAISQEQEEVDIPCEDGEEKTKPGKQQRDRDKEAERVAREEDEAGRNVRHGPYPDDKIHGPVPKGEDVVEEWTREEIEDAIPGFDKSIETRKQEQKEKSEDPVHRKRIEEELTLLRKLRKWLEDRRYTAPSGKGVKRN